MDKKGFLAGAMSHVIWGLLPLYWALLKPLDSIFILCNRILWSAVFTMLLLTVRRQLPELRAAMKDRNIMKYMVPAAITITINWGLYIFAVNSGHVMDASLGYYMNPLVVFALGVFLFKEKCNKLEIIALLLALAGVVMTTLQADSFPYIAVIIAISFAVYGALKKKAHMGGLTSVALETLLVAPLALLFVLLAPQSGEAFAQATSLQLVLLVLAGVMTALPLVLFAIGVNSVPFTVMGFLQYISPTLMLLTGILQGEPFTAARAISFGFIWAGLILFSIGMVRQARAEKAAAQET